MLLLSAPPGLAEPNPCATLPWVAINWLTLVYITLPYDGTWVWIRTGTNIPGREAWEPRFWVAKTGWTCCRSMEVVVELGREGLEERGAKFCCCCWGRGEERDEKEYI